jgi:hypothetical protein
MGFGFLLCNKFIGANDQVVLRAKEFLEAFRLRCIIVATQYRYFANAPVFIFL